MSVTTTLTRIAAMCRLISGIRTAFDNIPRTLDDSELPAIVIYPGAVVYDTDSQGDEIVVMSRRYTITLYLDRAGFGSEAQNQTAIVPFFEGIADYFLARPGLELAGASNPQDVSYNARLISDSGFQILAYPLSGMPYAAIEFILEVSDVRSISYQD